ncbi:MAG: GNAT family N-acetyltransferase [Pseudomonadota bacterium]
MALIIQPDALQGSEIAALLETHLDLMRSVSPPESVHALDLDALRADHITFWSARLEGDLVGCVALSELNPTHGEIKSMHTRQVRRGTGIGQALYDTLEKEARSRSYERLSLETGSTDDFLPARRLYARNGFEECGPFADYELDPFSTFMTKVL